MISIVLNLGFIAKYEVSYVESFVRMTGRYLKLLRRSTEICGSGIAALNLIMITVDRRARERCDAP